MQRETLTTGQVAASAGVNIQTLRYYERRGLLEEPDRRQSGYREYPRETVRLVRFIKRAQELGFTLDEIDDLLKLRGDRTSHCSEVRETARTKIEDIDHKIGALRAMKKALSQLVATCVKDGSDRRCPLLEALDEREPRRAE